MTATSTSPVQVEISVELEPCTSLLDVAFASMAIFGTAYPAEPIDAQGGVWLLECPAEFVETLVADGFIERAAEGFMIVAEMA